MFFIQTIEIFFSFFFTLEILSRQLYFDHSILHFLETTKHQDNDKSTTALSMRKLLQRKLNEQSEIHVSMRSEVKITIMIVHHNTFFNLSDHLTKIIKSEFQGSAAAEQFACGRTKTSVIVNCIGDDFKAQLLSDMKQLPFSIMIDGSNDTGIAKMYPITVRIFDADFNRVLTKFFDMNLIEGRTSGTTATTFEHVDATFEKNGFSWNSVTALGVDNTNANIGTHDSIKTQVLAKQPKVVIAGCPCHMLHNATGKGATALADITKFDIEDHCVDLFYRFDRSSKRKGEAKEYFKFCDTDYEKVVKYISVRWLCLERCLDRELKKYAALKSYFCSEHEREARSQ